jgi:hypothetical protein
VKPVVPIASGAASGGGAATPCERVDDDKPIGTVEMAADGTLTLVLRAESVDAKGCVTAMGDAQFVYRPGDRDYEMIRSHVAPIAPGETKPVKPWPPAR